MVYISIVLSAIFIILWKYLSDINKTLSVINFFILEKEGIFDDSDSQTDEDEEENDGLPAKAKYQLNCVHCHETWWSESPNPKFCPHCGEKLFDLRVPEGFRAKRK